MKPLELTQSHKDKILEMAKLVTPLDLWFSINDPEDTNLYYCFDDTPESKSYTEYRHDIHWHELSWQILNKICELHIKSPVKMAEQVKLYGLVCFNQSSILHPIDYLYEIFKESNK